MNNNVPSIRENKEVTVMEFAPDKLQLIKDTICKGSTNDEFQLFIHACKRTGLDPLMKQIYAVKRWDSNLKRESMTIQTGIDGYRLIAERTGRYCPGREPTYQYDAQGGLVSATAYVKKQTLDGTWHEVPATAFYNEFCQRTKEGKPAAMWMKIPHIMLAKCAESLELRKAFPGDVSRIYTKEEMQQAEMDIECKADLHAPKELISHEQFRTLHKVIGGESAYLNRILTHYKISCLEELDVDQYAIVLDKATKFMESKKPIEIMMEASVNEVVE